MKMRKNQRKLMELQLLLETERIHLLERSTMSFSNEWKGSMVKYMT